jgi:methylenetetrahydrofolate--tRNA-(uracil-5-)-methyltransferase
MTETITIIGGGLAGSEAAWQIASRGLHVDLVEMRPVRGTEAHHTDRLAELVCSNSLGSTLPDRALGILKRELLALGSMIVRTAFKHALPAGAALAVSRDDFAEEVTALIHGHPHITVHRREVTDIPAGPTIIATGPLTSSALAARIQALTGQQHLYFYDAMAPIVVAESIDMQIAFRQSRYDRESELGGDDGDYINCPLDKRSTRALSRPCSPHPRSN